MKPYTNNWASILWFKFEVSDPAFMSFVGQYSLQFLPKGNTSKYDVRKLAFLFSRIIIPFHSVLITKQCEAQGMPFSMLLNPARFWASAMV